MKGGVTLAIETSCDETAVALVSAYGSILCSEVASQIELHSPYGGVVPELASRNHSVDLRPLIDHTIARAGVTWSEIEAVGATSGPGLASSLLIGDTTAKAIAVALGRPFYSINHMEGHLLSPFIGYNSIPPHLALIVSGGHTLLVRVAGVGDYEVIGSTRDDAAGEAFDKVGKMLGLPYPGGPEISRRAAYGNPDAYEFPRSMIDSGDFAFSFSGLKTSALYLLQKLGENPSEAVINDICASFQEAIVEVLVEKAISAATRFSNQLIAVSGGVSCNPKLRECITSAAEKSGIEVKLALPDYSTDNAAMIAFAAWQRSQAGIASSSLATDINPNLSLAETR
mgnify:FL=1